MDSDSYKVLDHGYVKLIETWGSDERIIEAARMSTNKGFQGWGGDPCPECESKGRFFTDKLFKDYPACEDAKANCKCKGSGKTSGDEKLLKYLYEHKHMTPFEMGGMVIEVQAPIFVFREWHRHRTQSYNEMSARYTPLPDVNYIPTIERLMVNSKSNKQAGVIPGAAVLTEEMARTFQGQLIHHYQASESIYQQALANGIPKELARIHLPLGRYSRMRASTCLRNWLGFLTLRDDAAAQWEIQQFAKVVSTLIQKSFPRTHELYVGSR